MIKERKKEDSSDNSTSSISKPSDSDEDRRVKEEIKRQSKRLRAQSEVQ